MVTKKGDIVHLRVKKTSTGFKLYVKKHGRNTLVEETGGVENLVRVAKTSLGLTKACFGRKYKDIFKKKKGVYMMTEYSDSDDGDAN